MQECCNLALTLVRRSGNSRKYFFAACIRHLSNPLVHNFLTVFNFLIMALGHSDSEALIECIMSFSTTIRIRQIFLCSCRMSVIHHKSSSYECESVKAVK